jgi:GNAT superfamily N-acetyltransferase
VAASIELLHPADDPALGAALVMLQRAAYAVEARLIGHDIPVRAETPAELAVAGLRWWGHREGSDLLGAVAVTTTAELVDIERLVVAPHAARRGIGAALVGHVLAQAAGRRVVVATGRDNASARRLYERAGFTVVGDVEVAPGLWVTRYAREP